ncbi:hypothetical protein [Bacillus sp. C1]
MTKCYDHYKHDQWKHGNCCHHHHKPLKRKVLSTGVLNTVVGQTAAHIELSNVDPTRTFRVRVQVINWNSNSPVILLNEVVELAPNTHRFVSQNVSAFHYEIRIFHPGSPNVIANTFAINAATSTLPGLTFNQKELMELDIPFLV